MSEMREQRVAFVTGAAQGIGLGIARALVNSGMRVALGDVKGEEVMRSAEGLGGEAVGLAMDVTSAGDWERSIGEATGRWGRLDLLVNNAGISPRGTASSTDEALWDRTMAINLKGPWLGIKTAMPWLVKSKGTVVNIGSTRAIRPMPGLFSYVTSKAGLWGLTKQTAVECLELGVRCNMVAPGWVDTPGERVIQARQGRPDFPAGVQNLTTMDDVGDAVVFLASKAGRKINGLILYMDSGLSIADDAGMVYLPGDGRVRYHQPQNDVRGGEGKP